MQDSKYVYNLGKIVAVFLQDHLIVFVIVVAEWEAEQMII